MHSHTQVPSSKAAAAAAAPLCAGAQRRKVTARRSLPTIMAACGNEVETENEARCVSMAHRDEETLVVEQSRVVRLLEVLQAKWYLHRRPVLGAARGLALADGEAAELVGEIYDLLRELLDL